MAPGIVEVIYSPILFNVAQGHAFSAHLLQATSLDKREN
jgi:hypothetical protein